MIKIGKKNGDKILQDKSIKLLNAVLEISSFEALMSGDYAL